MPCEYFGTKKVVEMKERKTVASCRARMNRNKGKVDNQRLTPEEAENCEKYWGTCPDRLDAQKRKVV